MPALLTSTSSAGNSRTMERANATRTGSSARSHTRVCSFGCASFAARSLSSRRPQMITSLPAFRMRVASARPMPVAPPVTSTVCDASCIGRSYRGRRLLVAAAGAPLQLRQLRFRELLDGWAVLGEQAVGARRGLPRAFRVRAVPELVGAQPEQVLDRSIRDAWAVRQLDALELGACVAPGFHARERGGEIQ